MPFNVIEDFKIFSAYIYIDQRMFYVETAFCFGFEKSLP